MEREWKPNVEVSPACPRCGSFNTKFCYYNNYSLTQPRYFCKACRRYWTKGGSLRNVPIGGGCRKSRRGKSIRVHSTHSCSRALARDGIESSSSTSSCPNASATIDLAAVYANFLNQTPRPESQIEAHSELHDGTVIPSSIGFSNFPSLHTDQMSSHLPRESGFLECAPFPVGLSETQLLGDGNDICFSGYGAFDQNQELTTVCNNDNNFISVINPMDNTLLPPLPGEDEAVVSDGMLWPAAGPEVMLQNQILPSTTDHRETGAGTAEPVGQNSELLNGDLSPFSTLNLEAIFRS